MKTTIGIAYLFLIGAFPFSSEAQITFNDLLLLNKVSDILELVDPLLIEKGYSYTGKSKGQNGWTIDKWSYENGIAWVEFSKKVDVQSETGWIYGLEFYTISNNIVRTLQNQMLEREFGTDGENVINLGFVCQLYWGSRTIEEQLTAVLVGKKGDLYRFSIMN